MSFTFNFKLLRPFILFYVIGAAILFIIYQFTMGPQDGGFGTYALSLIAFALLVLINGIINFALAFVRKNSFYFLIALVHFIIFVGSALILGV